MSLCVQCGLSLSGDQSLCAHHPYNGGADWAAVNRIMCDMLHRKKVPTRLALLIDRFEEFPGDQ